MTTMPKNKVSDLETTRQKLAQMRDEIRLDLHLAKADVRDEWEDLEKKWGRLEGRLRSLRREAEETADDVWEDVRDLAKDLREGYGRIRRSF